MRWSPNYHHACRMQDKILKMIGVDRLWHIGDEELPSKGKKDLTPGQLATLVKAWDTLEERKRIIRMKPAPKAIDVTPKVKARSTGPIEA